MKLLHKIFKILLFLFILLIPIHTQYIIKEFYFEGSKWEFGTISFYITEFLFWILFLIFILIYYDEFTKFIKKLFRKYYFLIIILIVLILANFYQTEYKIVALNYILKFVEILAFGILIYIQNDLKKNTIFSLIILTGVLESILGIQQFFTQIILPNKWLGIAEKDPANLGVSVVQTLLRRYLRAYGTYPHPNILSFHIFTSLVLCIYLYNKIWEKAYLLKDFLKLLSIIIAFIILSFGLLFTFSRAGFICFWITILILSILSIKKIKQLRFPVYKFVIVFLICFIVFSYFFKELIISRSEFKAPQRINLIKEALNIIKLNPLIGIGIGNYGVYSRKIFDLKRAGYDMQPVHNIFLLIASEIGILGIIILGFFIFLILFKTYRKFPFMIGFLIPLILWMNVDHFFYTIYSTLNLVLLITAISIKKVKN